MTKNDKFNRAACALEGQCAECKRCDHKAREEGDPHCTWGAKLEIKDGLCEQFKWDSKAKARNSW